MKDTTFSTYNISQLLDVHIKTVSKWIDQGNLEGYTTPGGHRRAKKKAILKFLEKYHMPMPEEWEDSGRPRILIVDDEEPVLNVLAESLRKGKDRFIVETARDGFEAGQKISEFNPDLIVLDIFLPGLDGIKVCRMIKEKYDIMVITITGRGSEKIKQAAMKAGADAYLEKPFDLKDLADQVRALMGEMTSKV